MANDLLKNLSPLAMIDSTINFERHLRDIINDKALDDQIPSILNCFEYFELPKNSYFVEEGKICKYFCFIESGILQHSITTLGVEKTTYFAIKNTATSALKSFKNRVPSLKNIRAITYCTMRVIDLANFNYLLTHNQAFKTYYYNLIERQIFLIDDHRTELLTLKPEERYLKLLESEPLLFQEVPLRYLASFLGISTRHMTRIRKKSI